MAERGFFLETPRVLASELRRGAELPDFDMDAIVGLFEPAPEDWVPKPPSSASSSEAQAWEESFVACSNEVEKRASEQFDQVIGQVPFWFDIVREVNSSPEMQAASERLLECVAEGGGPKADSVSNLYLAIDQEAMQAATVEDLHELGFDMAELIAGCAGDFNKVRQDLLIPLRDEILGGYSEALAEADRYFNEVVAIGLGG